MKRILLCFTLAVLLPLSACGGNGAEQKLLEKLDYPMVITAETGELEYELTVRTEADAEAVMSSPKTLSGLVLTLDNDGVIAYYKGMTVPLPQASAKKVFRLCDIVIGIKKSIENNTFTAESTSDGYVFTTSLEDAVISLTCDAEGNAVYAEWNDGSKKTLYNIEIQDINAKEQASDAEQSG